PQSRVLRRAASGAADDTVFVGSRPCRVRQYVSAVFSGARAGASVVGPGGRLAELSRSVVERRAGAVLCRPVRSRRSRAGDAAVAHLDDAEFVATVAGPRADLARL